MLTAGRGQQLTKLDISGCVYNSVARRITQASSWRLTDETITALLHHASLVELDLGELPDISDESLRTLWLHFPSLTYLCLTPVVSPTLISHSAVSLHRNAQITDEGAAGLADCRALRRLSLNGLHRLTPALFETLLASLTVLKVVK
jgi:hypothetical protein